jgi:hypothetical protein
MRLKSLRRELWTILDCLYIDGATFAGQLETSQGFVVLSLANFAKAVEVGDTWVLGIRY